MNAHAYVHSPGVATCRQCPLEKCGWHYDEPSQSGDWSTPEFVKPDATTLAEYDGDPMGAVVYATVSAEVMRVEGILREHFETHPFEDWVLEVVRLRALLGQRPPAPDTWVRPSEERIENGIQEMIDLVRVARDIDGALDAPDSVWEPTRRRRDRFRTIVKHVLRGDAKYRFEHPEEPA